MIYPNELISIPESHAEEVVYRKLSKLADKYDIFYSKRFVQKSYHEKPEYEIDFIICKPNEAILCLEVKGGILRYDGSSNTWFQNSIPLNIGPDMQATSAAHNLISRYRDISREVPVGWAICSPDCELQNSADLPTSLDEDNIIDQRGLLYLDTVLESIFSSLKKQYPDRLGCKYYVYERFKNDLLRGLGFVQRLGTKFKHEDEKFIELAESQLNIFKQVAENDKIIVQGPAGSGKTIVAKELAIELSKEGKKVLLLCYNRTLANQIAYQNDLRNDDNVLVGSFHSFAKRFIEQQDAEWWTKQTTKDQGFWEIEVPSKMEEVLSNSKELVLYDALIIDEAQDFKEFWFELLLNLVRSSGKQIIFLDKIQDIFNRNVVIPNIESYVKFTLPENCRNTIKIVEYLEGVIDEPIKSRNNPLGDEVESYNAKNEIDLQAKLVNTIKELTSNHDLDPSQILILINSDKALSSISNLKKIGKYDVKALDNKARAPRNSIAYTNINTFKGLEWDIVFVIDTHLIEASNRKSIIYTEASRACHKLYVYSIDNE